MVTFIPRDISKELIAGLPDRSRRVLSDRFGLSGSGGHRTLDAIGKEYGITRERIRQIENHGIIAVRASESYKEQSAVWDELKNEIAALGGFISEEHLLEALGKTQSERNHILFLLTVGRTFSDRRANNHFQTRWHIDEQLAARVERALLSLYESLKPDALTPDEEMIDLFAKHLKQENIKHAQDEVIARWLSLSKRLGKNPLGEWGRVDSPHVRIKTTRDYAYLTLKRNGSPMHFAEVADTITQLFKRPVHPATTHNELIKDKRFVLVGRGLYALKEWGYEPGVVREVIRAILEKEGPMEKYAIIERVKRERYVKDATIMVNLQHTLFIHLPDGRYAVVQGRGTSAME
jgi:hypothetical protein